MRHELVVNCTAVFTEKEVSQKTMFRENSTFVFAIFSDIFWSKIEFLKIVNESKTFQKTFTKICRTFSQ